MRIANPSLLLMAALSASLLLSSVVQAQAFTPDQLTLKVKNLDAKSKNLEKTLTRVNNELKLVNQQLGKIGRLVGNRAMIEMLQRVDGLADEVSQLNGELEQQSHVLGGLKKHQRELYTNINRRLRDLESRATQQQAPDIPEVSSPSVDVGAFDSTTFSAEQAAYQSAFDVLKEGRYQKAKFELKAFLKKYPTSSFAGNAQYWLGEAHYVTREFQQGIKEFKKVLSNFPNSLKIPGAMLKLSYTYYELKQYDKAKLWLQDLRKRFPKSTAFRLAGKRLDRIRKEGH